MSIYLGTSAIASTGYDKANINLSNLTSQGQNIANWSNNVSNCITEIPQDIKLELNNGTLTLKAGSKVYVPNGFEADGVTPKFDYITTNSNISYTDSINRQCMFIVRPSDNFYRFNDVNYVFSGASAPSGNTYMVWYDTANNLVKITSDGGSTWDSGYSFPVSFAQSTTSGVSTILNIFNGFGYIGSTVFALPGVKGLIPNGRNDDGSLKSVEFTIDSVKTATRTWTWDLTNNPPYQNIAYVKYNNTDVNNTIWFFNHYIESKVKPAVYTYTFWYNPDTNIMYFNGEGSDYTQCQAIFLCNTWANGTTNVVEMWGSKKSPFHALDYNDSSTISGWSMPSSRYIDLTLGASDATYTAPANGYFCLSKETTGSQFIALNNKTSGLNANNAYHSSFYLASILPVRKGDIISVGYNAGGTTYQFRFYYVEGEN